MTLSLTLTSTLSPTLVPTLSGGTSAIAIIAALSGDSTQEYNFTQYSAAGETAYEANDATAIDAARSGSFLLRSTALENDAGNTNLFWVNDSGDPLTDGSQLTNNVTNLVGSPNLYHLSLGINDHAEVVAAGVTAADVQAGFEYYADRVKAIKDCPTILNTLGRDTGGNDEGANIITEGIQAAIAANSNLIRGIDVYDLPLTDAKHFTETGQVAMAQRQLQQAEYTLGNSPVQAKGAAITSATMTTDTLTVTLSHVNGNDITMPSSGAGGIDATDDGTAIGLTSPAKLNATSFTMAIPEGKSPVAGSVTKLWTPYGANGNGLNGAAPDVIKTNTGYPIQRGVITVTDSDPIKALDNVDYYSIFKGAVKTFDTTELTAIDKLAGTSGALTEVAAGDHMTWDATAFGGKGGAVLTGATRMGTAMTVGATKTVIFPLQVPATYPSSTTNLAGFMTGDTTTNAGRVTTTNVAKTLFYSSPSSGGSAAITPALVEGESHLVMLEFDTGVLNVYFDDFTTPFATIEPNSIYSSRSQFYLGARSSADDAATGFIFGGALVTSDNLTADEKTAVFNYLNSFFGI